MWHDVNFFSSLIRWQYLIDYLIIISNREALWKENSYVSLNIEKDNDIDEEEKDTLKDRIKFDDSDEEEETNSEAKSSISLNYVIGDVTKPKSSNHKQNIILHCTGKQYIFIYQYYKLCIWFSVNFDSWKIDKIYLQH